MSNPISQSKGSAAFDRNHPPKRSSKPKFTPLLAAFEGFKNLWHNTNTAWRAAHKIERVNFCSFIVSVFLGLLHTLHTSSDLIGGSPLLYLEIQTVLILFGLVLLLLHSYQRLGVAIVTKQRQGDEHERAIGDLKKETEARIKALQARHEDIMRRIQQHHRIAIRAMQNSGNRRRAIFCKNFHGVGHLTRDLVTILFNLYAEPPKSLVVGTIVEYCNSLARFFNELYDIEFSVAVKVLISPWEIVTIARDEITHRSMRSHGDAGRVFRLEKNTAYYSLVSGDKRIFACDDLSSLDSLAYQNETPGWQDLYNATACVPIRKSCVDNTDLFEMVGFLAVDCLPLSKTKAVFCKHNRPDKDIQNLLLGYADILFAILKRGRPIANTMLGNKDGYVLDFDNFGFIKDLHETFSSGQWQRVQSFHLNAPPYGQFTQKHNAVEGVANAEHDTIDTFNPEI